MVVVQFQLVHQRQGSSGALHLADGDGAVEGHDRCGGDCKQLVVQGDNLRPVGLLDCRSVRMHRVDGGLELIRTGVVAAKAPAKECLTLLDQGPIPSSAVLLAEQHEGAVGPRPRCSAGLGQEQQRQQAGQLWLGGHERRQESCQPDRLRAEPRLGWAAQPGVVDEVDDGQHGAQAVGQLVNLWHAVGDAGGLDLSLGAREALRHRRFGDQEGSCDFRG